ncbi:hypothetical protein BDV96DRAFT_592623 [Lophiotrema nucula]|uniref:Uncharacterized protein n=1 Tax=Lophiotrema nucula TaxID=690887 RepID=A0A6A5YGM2_9PLEO|nr:hypothetical protein BDV96DRAFT_592623 [Lophiotrema nucula]
MEDTEGRHGVVTKIWTSFSHPMKFDSEGTCPSSCSFCTMPCFGMVGYTEKQVHVLKWDNGLGYSELAGGHRDTFDNTYMCQQCVMDRVQVMFCPGHEIKTLDNGEQDFDQAAADLMEAEPATPMLRFQLQRWCSMCFSLAAYQCCAAQPDLMGASEEGEAMLNGCGLRLCASCECKLRKDFGCECDAMAATLDKEPKMRAKTKDGTIVTRADVGFLTKEGLLMRNVDQTSPNDVEAEDGGEMEF